LFLSHLYTKYINKIIIIINIFYVNVISFPISSICVLLFFSCNISTSFRTCAIVKACNNNNIPPEKWLGKSQIRYNAKTQAQGDQVCGVSVSQGSTGWFTGLGFYGATPSTMA